MILCMRSIFACAERAIPRIIAQAYGRRLMLRAMTAQIGQSGAPDSVAGLHTTCQGRARTMRRLAVRPLLAVCRPPIPQIDSEQTLNGRRSLL